MPADSMIPLYSSLVGGACAIAGSLATSTWNKRSERQHEARQLAKAFKGELCAIVSILGLRNYQAGLRAAADRCRTDQSVHVYCVSAQEEYRAIYKANASKIGCLPGTLPEQIAIFYTVAASLIEDFNDSVEIRDGKRDISVLGSPTQAAQKYSRVADYIDDLVNKAQVAVAEIDRLYPV